MSFLRFCIPCGLLLFGYASADEAALALSDVQFVAACDGASQAYVVGLPPGFDAAQDHDLLIALHGHGSDRWQFAKEPRDECRSVRDAAMARQMIFVSPDYRAKTSWMGPKAEADLVQIIADLKKGYRVRRVILCGGSMGGSSALTFAALHPDLIQGVAAMNPTANHLEYTQFQDAIRESFGGSKQDIPLEYKNRSAEYWPERFTMPLAISTGGKDDLVPPQSAQRLAAVLTQLGRPVLLIHREETGHTTSYDDARAILDFACSAAKTP